MKPSKQEHFIENGAVRYNLRHDVSWPYGHKEKDGSSTQSARERQLLMWNRKEKDLKISVCKC